MPRAVVDSHCHLPADPVDADPICDPLAAAVEWMVFVGADLGVPGRGRPAERPSDVVATVGLHPHDAIRSRRLGGAARARGGTGGGRGRRGRARPPLRALARSGPSDGVPCPDSIGPRARPGARDPHPGSMGRDVRDSRRGRDAPPDGLPLFHRWPDEAAACIDARRRPLVQRDRHVQERRRRARRGRDRRRSDRMLVETDSPYLAPVPHRGRPPGRPGWGVGEGLEAGRGTRECENLGRRNTANAARCFPRG